mmetsp:Transcript_3330/g.6294  ORF Transcript_3330/g.6294 Transcript_3330/m.6294 type:complete len:487 (-) Transcript_3330:558-2018(-)
MMGLFSKEDRILARDLLRNYGRRCDGALCVRTVDDLRCMLVRDPGQVCYAHSNEYVSRGWHMNSCSYDAVFEVCTWMYCFSKRFRECCQGKDGVRIRKNKMHFRPLLLAYLLERIKGNATYLCGPMSFRERNQVWTNKALIRIRDGLGCDAEEPSMHGTRGFANVEEIFAKFLGKSKYSTRCIECGACMEDIDIVMACGHGSNQCASIRSLGTHGTQRVFDPYVTAQCKCTSSRKIPVKRVFTDLPPVFLLYRINGPSTRTNTILPTTWDVQYSTDGKTTRTDKKDWMAAIYYYDPTRRGLEPSHYRVEFRGPHQLRWEYNSLEDSRCFLLKRKMRKGYEVSQLGENDCCILLYSSLDQTDADRLDLYEEILGGNILETDLELLRTVLQMNKPNSNTTSDTTRTSKGTNPHADAERITVKQPTTTGTSNREQQVSRGKPVRGQRSKITASPESKRVLRRGFYKIFSVANRFKLEAKPWLRKGGNKI